MNGFVNASNVLITYIVHIILYVMYIRFVDII